MAPHHLRQMIPQAMLLAQQQQQQLWWCCSGGGGGATATSAARSAAAALLPPLQCAAAAAAATAQLWPAQQQHLARSLWGSAALSAAAAAEEPQEQRQQRRRGGVSQPLPPLPATRHERRVDGQRFNEARAAWRAQVKELRKGWLKEHRERVAAHEAGAEAARRQVALLRAARDAGKRHDRDRLRLERDVRAAERAVEAAGRRLAAACRQDMREETLQRHKELRRAELLEESRGWVPPEQLEQRIAEALERPVSGEL